jgi:hypothetical protein
MYGWSIIMVGSLVLAALARGAGTGKWWTDDVKQITVGAKCKRDCKDIDRAAYATVQVQ